MIGLIGALPMEVEPLLRRLENRRFEQSGPYRFCLGSLSGTEAVILCCGVGKVNAALGTQAMLMRYAPDLIIHTGVGGGLLCGLEIGDLVVACDSVQYDVDNTATGMAPGFVATVERISFPCDPDVSKALLNAGAAMRKKGRKVLQGRVATADRFLTDAEEKRAVVEEFGAMICDQESAAVAHACCIYETSCAIVRAVSDTSDGRHAEEFANYGAAAARAAAELIWKYMVKTYPK